jgi:hypothetical protein
VSGKRAIGAIRTALIVVGVAGLLRIVPSAAATSSSDLALVGSMPISVSLYRHWKRIEHVSNPHIRFRAQRRATMRFLLAADWTLGAAAEMGIVVSDAQATTSLDKLRREAFPTKRAFDDFLRSTGQTIADLKFREKLNLLNQRLAKTEAMPGFVAKWRARTLCRPLYRVAEYCGGTLS